MKKILTFYSIFLVLLSATPDSDAASGTWNQTTGGPYLWSGAANWTGGVPNATADIATITADLTSNLTINLDLSVALNILIIGDVIGASTPTQTNFSYTINPLTGQTITFNRTDAIPSLLTKNGIVADTINAQIIVNCHIDAAVNNSSLLILGGGLVINGNGALAGLERLNKLGDGTLRVTENTILGVGARILTSNGTLDIRGGFNRFSSQLETTGGTTNISGLYSVFDAVSSVDNPTGNCITVTNGTLNFAPVTTSFGGGATTNASTTVTVTSTTGLVVGQQIFGTGITAGTTVFSITNATQFVLSAPATATNTGQTFVASAPNSTFISSAISQAAGTLRFGLDNASANAVLYGSQITKTGGNLWFQNGSGLGTTTVLGGGRVTPAAPTTVTSGNATISVNSTTGLLVGMRVFGPGIPAGAIINSVVANTSITISLAPTATNTNVSLMFGEGIQNVAVNTTSGSNLVAATNTSGLAVGMVVSGANIPAGATIIAINPNVSVTLSAGANATATGATTLNSYVLSNLTLDNGVTEVISGIFSGPNNGSGTVNFDPSIRLILNNAAQFSFADAVGPIQNFTFYSLNSSSLNTLVRSDRGSSTLTVGNYSGTDDTFLGRLYFAGSSSILIKVGSNTLTLGGNTDNSAARVNVLEGTVILAKNGDPAWHAIGANSTIGDADAAVETLKIGGTAMAAYAASLPVNLKDQIFRAVDMTINATGVLDLNGNSEGFNGLTGAGSVVNNVSGTTSTLILGENDSSATVNTLIRNNTIGTGIVALIKSGVGTMTFTNNDTYTGSTLIGRGTMTLQGPNGALSGTSAIRVADGTLLLANSIQVGTGVTNGTNTVTVASTANLFVGQFITGTNITNGTTISSITNGTTFVMSAIATGSSSGLTFTFSGNNNNRINDAASLTLSNATFQVRNSNVTSGEATTEIIGSFIADKGHDLLRTERLNNVAANTVRIQLGTYSRNGGSQVSIIENTGNSGFGTGITPDTALSQVTVGTIPTALLLGANGTNGANGAGIAGTPNVSLLLGAFGGNNGSNTNEFMTVQTVGGVHYIRPLNNGGTEYLEMTSGTITSQVGKETTANNIISANTAFNSARFSGTTVTTIANDKALKLGGNTDANFGATAEGAGMMITAGTTTITGGYLDFGIREAIFRLNSATTIQSTITGTNALFGLTRSGGGQLDLAGANTYSGETVLAQGLTRVLRSGALGLGGTNNGTSLMGFQTLALAGGVIVGNYDSVQTTKRENLTMGPSTVLAGYDQNNVWGGDITLDAASESGQNINAIIRPFSDTAVISINGRVSGGGSDVNITYNGASGRYLYLDGLGKRESIININGAISDENFGSATLSDSQKLNVVVRGTFVATDVVNEFHVNITDASKLHGALDLRSGFVRLASDYGTDAQFGVTQNIVMRLRDSGLDSTNQFAALLMTTAGTTYNVPSIVWGDNSTGYSAYSYGMLGTEITSGVVTVGNGTGNLDLTPSEDAIGTPLLNAATATGTAGQNFLTVGAADINKLRIGMNFVGSNIAASTYILSINYSTNVVTINNALTGTTGQALTLGVGTLSFNDMLANGNYQRYADARLYAAEGGELNLRMRLIDEGGFSLDNEVGAVTKIGRGVVRLSGSNQGNGSLDGGLNLHGGTLILDYSLNNFRKVTEGVNTQAPLTLAGGDLFLQGSAVADSTEEIRGVLFMRPGESLIHVKPGGNPAFTTTLNIGLPANLLNNVGMLPARYAGSSMVFWRDSSTPGNATITLEIPDLYAQEVALPWALWADPATGKVTDFAYVQLSGDPLINLAVKDANGSAKFLQENGADFWNDTDNIGNFKHYIAETSELLPGEGSGFFGTYVPSALKNQGDNNSIGNILFNIDNDNTNGTDYPTRPDPNNELKIAAGETLILKSNLATGFLGGAILIANTVGDTNKKISGGSISSGLETTYFDPNVANTLVKTYDLLIHNYAEIPDLVTPALGGGIFTIASNIVNNPADALTPLNLVHNGTGWTKMERATTVGLGYSYTGKTFFNGGTLWVSDPNKLGADTAGTVSDRYYFTGGRLLVGDLTNPIGTSLGSLTLDIKRGITIGGDGAFIDIANAATTLNYSGLISVEVQAPTFAAGITRTTNIGLGDLFKQGAGTLVLSNAAHTYSGLTSVEAGVLQININAAPSVTTQNSGYLGSNYSYIDGTFVKTGGTLDLQITGGATNGTSEWITLDGGTLRTTALHTDGTLDGLIRVRQSSTVNVAGTGTLRFNSTAGYLTSSGATGTPTLTKTGTGTLLLFENNTDYAGNWAVNQGRVVGVTQGLPFGTGAAMSVGQTGAGSGVAEVMMSSRTTPTVALTSGATTLSSATVTVANTAGLYVGMPISGANIPVGAVITSITSGTTFTISANATLTASGGTFTATLNFINTMDYHVGSNITVSTGAQVKRIGATNNSVIANSGQQNDRYNYDGSITLNGNLLVTYEDNVTNTGIAASGRDQFIALNGNISGAGTLTTEITYTGNTGADQNDLRITTELNGDNTACAGSLSMGNATNDADLQHLVRLGNSNALKSDNQVNMNFNSTLQVGGQAVTMGNLMITPTGNATTNQVFVENASNTAGTLTITQTTNEDWDVLFRDGTTPAVYSAIAPLIRNNTLSIVKDGAGIATITQANTYTGTTLVSAGTLLANNTAGTATGTGVVTVNSGATLGGTGVIAGNTTINSGGTLLIGNPTGDVGPQDLQFNGTLNSSGTFAVDLWIYSVGSNGTADILTFGSNAVISLTGTLQVTNSTPTTATSFINGSAWQIIDWAVVTAPNRTVNFSVFNLPVLTGGLSWDTSALATTGFISVATVPEPGRAMLLFVALIWMIGCHRRRA